MISIRWYLGCLKGCSGGAGTLHALKFNRCIYDVAIMLIVMNNIRDPHMI